MATRKQTQDRRDANYNARMDNWNDLGEPLLGGCYIFFRDIGIMLLIVMGIGIVLAIIAAIFGIDF